MLNALNARRVLAIVVLASVHLMPFNLSAQELLTNGGFESGDSTGWSLIDRAGTGSFNIHNSTTTPGGVANHLAGPADGNWFAVTDPTASDTHALLQS